MSGHSDVREACVSCHTEAKSYITWSHFVPLRTFAGNLSVRVRGQCLHLAVPDRATSSLTLYVVYATDSGRVVIFGTKVCYIGLKLDKNGAF